MLPTPRYRTLYLRLVNGTKAKVKKRLVTSEGGRDGGRELWREGEDSVKERMHKHGWMFVVLIDVECKIPNVQSHENPRKWHSRFTQ